MKIGISSSMIRQGRSRVGQYVLELVRALSRHADKHEFVLFALDEDRHLLGAAADAMRVVTVPERCRDSMADIAWHQTELPRLARNLRLDVLHVPTFRRLLWPRPCALVATIHNIGALRAESESNWKKAIYDGMLSRWLVQRQDAFIAVSRSTHEEILSQFTVPPDKLTVVHNGVDHKRFHPDSRLDAVTAVAARYRLHDPFFLYVSPLEYPEKNHVRLIHAFERFKASTGSNWQLVFVGRNGCGADVIHERRRCSEFAGDIHWLDFINSTELPLLYRAAGVFVWPSLSGEFAMPPLEAMASGCPVLCSMRGAMAENIGTAGLSMDTEDSQVMERQLTLLATCGGLRERLRTAGLGWARQFNWQHTADETVAVYLRAVVAAAREGETYEAQKIGAFAKEDCALAHHPR